MSALNPLSHNLLFEYNTVDPLYMQILDPRTQPTTERKYLKKSSRMFQKEKLEFAAHWELFTLYLHCIGHYKKSRNDLKYIGGCL